MKQYCLIGHPLGHSLSAELHRRLMELSGVQGAYTLEDIDPDALAGRADQLRKLDGFNITIPYKKAIVPYLDEVDETAAKYGAVNTVNVRGGRMKGYNTDAPGFLRALAQAGIPLGGQVLLCGTGGVSSMMARAALDAGCELTVASRTISASVRFADALQEEYPAAQIKTGTLAYVSGSYDLLLNGTPAGMWPEIRECPVPPAVARSARCVFDAVYNPEETVLLKTAAKGGAKICGGLSMLVWQGAEAQKIWNGTSFSEEAVAALTRELSQTLALLRKTEKS